jgi:hypothetical protein
MSDDKEIEVSPEEDLKPKPPARLAPRGIRTFTMCRRSDETGISGTGVVVEGVLLATGQVILHWLSPPPIGSIAIFNSMNDFVEIHILSHLNNGTIITFDDGEQMVYNIDGTKEIRMPDEEEKQ